MTRLKTISSVSDYQLCCGCGVCAYVYPDTYKMVDISSFGNRPVLKKNQHEKNLCYKVGDICPGVSLNISKDISAKQNYIESLFKTWGPIYEIWEGHAVDGEIRHSGSSGGVITAISLFCLEMEKMKGVLHVKADKLAPYLNTVAISKDKKSLIEGTGSRYSPASPCEKLHEIENLSGPAVVIGKPCDIAAVEKVSKLKENLNSKIGLKIACFCAGTPSTDGTIEMLRQMGVSSLTDLEMLRYRGNGWPGKTMAEYLSETGKRRTNELSYEESWGGILEKYRQWRCYICPDHTGEFADLAVGDPWYRELTSDSSGSSLILVRSERGKELLRKAIEQNYIVAERRENFILKASQINLEHTRSRLWGQIFALKLLNVPCPDYGGFSLFENWKVNLSIKEKLRSILGTTKRVFVKKLKMKCN